MLVSEINIVELAVFMSEISDGSEDLETTVKFLEHLDSRDMPDIRPIVRDWDMFNEIGKAEIAINFAGLHHASRFIMLIEYLIAKYNSEGDTNEV